MNPWFAEDATTPVPLMDAPLNVPVPLPTRRASSLTGPLSEPLSDSLQDDPNDSGRVFAAPAAVPKVTRARSTSDDVDESAARSNIARTVEAHDVFAVRAVEVLPARLRHWTYLEKVSLETATLAADLVVRQSARAASSATSATNNRESHLALAAIVTIVLVTGFAVAFGGANDGTLGHELTAISRSAPASAASAKGEPATVTPIQPETDGTVVPEDDAATTGEPSVSPIAATTHARFTTEPAGAILTLVEDGEPHVLGPAPAEAELDPNKSYELLVEHPNYWSDVRLLEANTLDSSNTASDSIKEHIVLARKTKAQPAATKRRVAAARSPKPRHRSAGIQRLFRAGKGTLMLNAKPPCDIHIDGKDTGLTTPRRDLFLKPGKHTVLLVNKEFGIHKQFTVQIKAGKQVRIAKNLLPAAAK